MIQQVRQCRRHADEPHLAGLLELQQRIEGAVLFQGLLRRRSMELDDVEMVGLHPGEALLDALDDVVPGEDMLAALPGRSGRRTNQTAALAGQVKFRAPMTDVTTDPLFAQPV